MKSAANLLSRRNPDRLLVRAHQHTRRLPRRLRRFLQTGHPRGCSQKSTRCSMCQHRLKRAKDDKTSRRREHRLNTTPFWDRSIRQ